MISLVPAITHITCGDGLFSGNCGKNPKSYSLHMQSQLYSLEYVFLSNCNHICCLLDHNILAKSRTLNSIHFLKNCNTLCTELVR